MSLSLALCGALVLQGAPQVFREDFRESVEAHIPVVAEDLSCEFLDLVRHGASKDLLKLSFHPHVPGDPHYVWNGECAGATMLEFRFAHALDLTDPDAAVRLRCKNFGSSRLHLALKTAADGWVVCTESIGVDSDWTERQLTIAPPSTPRPDGSAHTWRTLDLGALAELAGPVVRPDWSRTLALGWVSPVTPKSSNNCCRLDWFALDCATASIQPRAGEVFPPVSSEPASDVAIGGFYEPGTRVLTSALLVNDGPALNRTRRGVVVRIGPRTFGCFDTDLLRWSAVWRAPKGLPPLSLDSMAAASYPKKSAKAVRPPALRGQPWWTSRERPGAQPGTVPSPDPRTAVTLTDGRKLGALPTSLGRFDGYALEADGVWVTYQLPQCGCTVRETMRVFDGRGVTGLERVLRVSASTAPFVVLLDAAVGDVHGDGSSITLRDSTLPHLEVEGEGVALRSEPGLDARPGSTFLVVAPGSEDRVVRVRRAASIEILKNAKSLQDESAGDVFADYEAVVRSPAASEVGGLFAVRNFALPESPQRVLRPTDIAFLPSGDLLMTTLDGDVWRIADPEQSESTWRRVAAGLFEPLGIDVDADGRVFVLGRDAVIELMDADQDGRYDVHRTASNAFLQTLHTRDYATSLVVEPDGSFLIAKGGIVDPKPRGTEELGPHRGTVLRLSPDGAGCEVLAEGLRLPYVGARRSDGAVFVSDQQGNFTPSTPVHWLEEGRKTPYFGYAWTRAENSREITPPLTWYPYQSNRSGAGFATLSAQGFPSLGDVFAHISWNGRLFPIETGRASAPGIAPAAEVGWLPFSWRLPLQLAFPALKAATHPQSGALYVVGLGISGYLPTTPKHLGLASVREVASTAGRTGAGLVAAPSGLKVTPDGIEVVFKTALPRGARVTVASLKLWDIRRTKEYGSGHFRWDGTPGEHVITPTRSQLSDARDRLEIAAGPLCRSSLLELRLAIAWEVESAAALRPGYEMELYARPEHLPVAGNAAGPNAAGPKAAASAEERVAAPSAIVGDAAAGKLVYERFSCGVCHSLDGGTRVGPPLNGVATRHAGDGLREFLRTSVTDPSREITKGYEQVAMTSYAGVIPDTSLEDLIAFLAELK